MNVSKVVYHIQILILPFKQNVNKTLRETSGHWVIKAYNKSGFLHKTNHLNIQHLLIERIYSITQVFD